MGGFGQKIDIFSTICFTGPSVIHGAIKTNLKTIVKSIGKDFIIFTGVRVYVCVCVFIVYAFVFVFVLVFELFVFVSEFGLAFLFELYLYVLASTLGGFSP